MRVSAIIPNQGAVVSERGLVRMGVVAEEAGADGLWVSDHLVMVDRRSRNYPFSAEGTPPWRLDADYFEALTCCSFLLSATTTARVGTAVLVASQRHVLELAKMTASMDQLGGGRLDLGVGAGWNRAEMESLGFDPRSRGQRLDQVIDALRDCWGGRPAARTGRHVRLAPDVLVYPMPAEPGGPPILVGGLAEAALHRAAKLGDGWLGIAFVKSFDRAELARSLGRVRALRRELGRAGDHRDVLKLHAGPHESDRVPALLSQVRDLGFDEVIVEPPWGLGTRAAAAFLSRCLP